MISTDKIIRERERVTHDFLVVGTKDSIVDLDSRWWDLGFGHRDVTNGERGGMGARLKKRSSEGGLYSWERCLDGMWGKIWARHLVLKCLVEKRSRVCFGSFQRFTITISVSFKRWTFQRKSLRKSSISQRTKMLSFSMVCPLSWPNLRGSRAMQKNGHFGLLVTR